MDKYKRKLRPNKELNNLPNLGMPSNDEMARGKNADTTNKIHVSR